METSKNFWLLLAIIATLFETGRSIRCYQCTSKRDPKCADPVSGDIQPTQCTRDSITSTLNEIINSVRGSPGITDIFFGSTFSCLKINSLSSNQHQNMTVIRGCYYEKTEGKEICTMLRSKIIDQSSLPFCETCNGDACNGSYKLSSTVSLTSTFLPLFAAFYFLRQ